VAKARLCQLPSDIKEDVILSFLRERVLHGIFNTGAQVFPLCAWKAYETLRI